MKTNETITNGVLMHHLTAFGNTALDEILNDYTEESEVMTPDGKLTGLTVIRSFFADFFAVIPTGSAFEIKQKIVSGNVACSTWRSESEVATIPMGTDTFFVDGDKIRFHTVADYRVNT